MLFAFHRMASRSDPSRREGSSSVTSRRAAGAFAPAEHVQHAELRSIQHIQRERSRGAQFLGGPQRQSRTQSAIHIELARQSPSAGSRTEWHSEAARCSQVISRSRTMRVRSDGNSTMVNANGTRG